MFMSDDTFIYHKIIKPKKEVKKEEKKEKIELYMNIFEMKKNRK